MKKVLFFGVEPIFEVKLTDPARPGPTRPGPAVTLFNGLYLLNR